MAHTDSAFQLQNGLSCYTRHDDTVKSLCLMVDVYAGSADDDMQYAGEHHAFEHLPFRGTRKFPSNHALTYPLEKYSADVNANTGFLRTRYFITLPSRVADLAAEHLADLVFCPLLTAEDWQSERGVILQEWELQWKNPTRVMGIEIFSKFFAGTSMSCTPIGHPECLGRLGIERLQDIHQRDYTVENCQIVAAGFLPPDFRKVLEQWFGVLDIPRGENRRTRELPFPGEVGHWSFSNPLFKQPQLALLSFFRESLDHRRNASQELARMMLTEGFSSPLFQEFRTVRNWVYGFHLGTVSVTPQVESVTFTASSSAASAADFHDLFRQCVDQAAEDKERFDFAKSAQLSYLDMKLNRPADECNMIADDLLFGLPILSRQDMVELFQRRTYEEVRESLLHFFNPDKLVRLTGQL